MFCNPGFTDQLSKDGKCKRVSYITEDGYKKYKVICGAKLSCDSTDEKRSINFTFDFNSNQNTKSKYIPETLPNDSEIYKLALRFYKDIYDLSDDEFEHFKKLLINSKLIYFNNNTTKTFKVGPDKILKDDLISLNIVNAICICPERGEGTSDFLLSISRDGTVGAFESYGLYEKKIIPDTIMDSLECIDTSNLEPDNLLD